MTARRTRLAPAAPAPGPGLARKSWRKRLAVLLAAITVPAMAATGGVGALPGPAVESTAALATRKAAAAALPFERPGMSFPGSAFYYMADPAGSALVALPTADPLARGAAESGRELGALIDVGAAAKPFFTPGSGITHMRAQECLAQAVWYEAASESEAGQRAVAQVVLNRVAHPAWPASVCGVVYQGSQRSTGCQFTFTCDGSLGRRPSGSTWARAQRIAGDALSGDVYAPVGLATHYHTLWVNPYWAGTLDHIGTIGAHRFYRNRGAGGQAAAFAASYAGFEPVVSGRTTPAPASVTSAAYAPLDTAPDRPIIAYDLGPVPAKAGSAKAASPDASTPPSEPASGTGAVKAEYARAGQWKTQPNTAAAATPAE
ncbi:cell wall hydrolase [Porphyrobacter sp. AAP60]|uniref:cell wall hydrolase n=1 Tax=Porphyrobacter sp. AAP60 TaxID=1523423 RepID=UPI0009E7268B|nr:cell wall hydrolase [Porphyrobacter sp. AAP60]